MAADEVEVWGPTIHTRGEGRVRITRRSPGSGASIGVLGGSPARPLEGSRLRHAFLTTSYVLDDAGEAVAVLCIEHILASCWLAGLSDFELLVDCTATTPEAPVGPYEGSFVEHFVQGLGFEHRGACVGGGPFEDIRVEDQGRWVLVRRASSYQALAAQVSQDPPGLFTAHFDTRRSSLEDAISLSCSRSWIFADDVARLSASGRLGGLSGDAKRWCRIVRSREDALSEPSLEESSRHRLYDLIGDLSVHLFSDLALDVRSIDPGHALNERARNAISSTGIA